MLLSPIVLKIRTANTTFGNQVAGAAEIADVFSLTHAANTAFVIQTSEECDKNQCDTAINQLITEQFSVVVALANDTTQKDKTGLTAYDTLYTVRSELFSCLLGWLMIGAETLTCYRGGRLLGFDRSYLWYQFVFEADFRLTQEDGVNDPNADDFNTIYAQYVLAPDILNLPYAGALPVTLFTIDSTQQIDLTTNPDAGAFSKEFTSAFDVDYT